MGDPVIVALLFQCIFLKHPSLSVGRSPSLPAHSYGILQSFIKGHIIPADPLIWEKDQKKEKNCPFSTCLMEKNKKALQNHLMFIHWGCQRTRDGPKPDPCPPVCRHVQDHVACMWEEQSQPLQGLTAWRWTEKRLRITFVYALYVAVPLNIP